MSSPSRMGLLQAARLRPQHRLHDSNPNGPATPWLESVNCLHCGGAGHDLLLSAEDRFGLGAFRIVRCRQCELAFTNPRPTVDSIARCYPADYSCHDLSTNWDTRLRARWKHWLERAVLRAGYGYPIQPADWQTRFAAVLGRASLRNAQRRSGWLQYRGQGRLLDFGCGAGGYLRRMQDHGWRVEGLDTSASTAEAVTRQTGIRVHVGGLPHAALAPQSFDAITMWQSLEHVHLPRQVARAAFELLAPGGQLVVAVPNLASWSFAAFGSHWFGLDAPRHLTHFTPDTLANLLQAEGFCLRQVQTLGNDGWLRHSARRASVAGFSPWWLPLFRKKSLARTWAGWTQRRAQGDVILALAERPLTVAS